MNISSIMKNKNYSSQSKIQCAFKTKNRSCFFFITSAIHKSNHVSQCSSSIWEPSYPLLKLFFFSTFFLFFFKMISFQQTNKNIWKQQIKIVIQMQTNTTFPLTSFKIHTQHTPHSIPFHMKHSTIINNSNHNKQLCWCEINNPFFLCFVLVCFALWWWLCCNNQCCPFPPRLLPHGRVAWSGVSPSTPLVTNNLNQCSNPTATITTTHNHVHKSGITTTTPFIPQTHKQCSTPHAPHHLP